MKVATRQSDVLDPRTFVKSAPLPWSSPKGVKIQARTFNVYNAELPTREDVRKENYLRRRDQMTSMGFQTPINLPYKPIGEPIYLDPKQIILYGLGQLNESDINKKELEKQVVSLTKVQETKVENQVAPAFTYRSLKKSKEILSLQNEVNKTKEFIRKVKLGQSLFDLLNQEEQERKKKSSLDKESISTAMQLKPMRDSDEELEQDLSEDEVILTESNRYFENSSPGGFSSFFTTHNNTHLNLNHENTGMSLFSEHISTDKVNNRHHRLKIYEETSAGDNHQNEDTQFPRPHTHPHPQNLFNNSGQRPHTVPLIGYKSQRNSASTTLRRPKTSANKKYKDLSKPYTPIYSNLLYKDEETLLDKKSITRQLCVLLWILESINSEPNTVGQLRTCFLVKDLGGEKLTEKALQKMKEKETKWNNFKKVPNESKKEKQTTRFSHSKLDKSKKKTKISTTLNITESNGNDELFSAIQIEEESESNKDVAESIQESSQSQILALSQNQQNSNTNNTSQNLDSNRDSISLSNIDYTTTARDSVLNQNYDNLTSSNNPTGAYNSRISSSVEPIRSIRLKSDFHKLQPKQEKLTLPQSLYFKNRESTLTDYELELLKIGDEIEMEKIFNKVGIKQERKDSKNLKASTGPIRAVWTQEVINYQSTLPSIKKTQKLEEIKTQFDNSVDEGTIEIHKRLEELMNKRVKTCMVKYSSMDFGERGLHKMLNAMNKGYLDYQRSEDLKNTPEPKYYQWYSDLEYIIETNFNKDDCILSKLLDKISVYGKLNAKKQNEASFFRILDTLRIWEMLSPDVMSAIEFCRERIFEIQEDEFESWFKKKTQKHPELFVSRKTVSNQNNTKNKT